MRLDGLYLTSIFAHNIVTRGGTMSDSVARLTNDTVQETLALDWKAEKSGNRMILTHDDLPHGHIVIDFELRALVYTSNSASADEINDRLETEGKTAEKDFNVLRLLSAEGSAISDMKDPRRAYKSPFDLFKAMDNRASAGEGSSTVFEFHNHNLNGTVDVRWILVEWDEENKVLNDLEAALTELTDSKKRGNKVSERRARNKVYFLTRQVFIDRVLKVGELTQGGWIWLEALLDQNDAWYDMESFAYGYVWCDRCKTVSHPSWWGNDKGDYLNTMRRIYDKHLNEDPKCDGKLHC